MHLTPIQWRGLITQAMYEGLIPSIGDIFQWNDDKLTTEGQQILRELEGRPDAAKLLQRAYYDRPVKTPQRLKAPLYRSPRHPRPTIRNLIYHVCPLISNDHWRKNIEQLRKRLDVFNGRKTIAIATGPGCHGAKSVRDEFIGRGCDFLELPNDREFREVVSFLPLLLTVADPDPRQATFYAHTKGNSTAENVKGSVYWRNAAYHHLLDRVDDCLEELETHAAVGMHKMRWPVHHSPYPSSLMHGTWMLAGTFFWFRNDAVFSHPRWRYVPPDRYGAEAWLSGLFCHAEAASVYQLWPEEQFPTPSPYEPSLYPDPIDDE